MLKTICAAVLLMAAAVSAQAETLIPRSAPGGKGTYYLLESKKSGGVIQAINKRTGPSGTTYTKTETNCGTMQMRQLGYSEESPQAIKDNPTQWFDLVPGSSKSDLANFVCRR